MLEEKLDIVALRKLNLPKKAKPDLTRWNEFLKKHKKPKHTVNIGLIGKYVELQDSYKSILEAFVHSGASNQTRVNVVSIHSEYLNRKNVAEKLAGLDGVLVAPGFGERGIEGKIEAIRYARENNIPFFGICLGMQCAVIEYARNVLGLTEAHTAEIDPTTKHPVIDLMSDQHNISDKGGTMRLGAYKCEIKPDTVAYEIYGQSMISERHRHRYEFNNAYKTQFENHGMIASGVNPENDLVEIVEIPLHPWFVGVQFHPEYKSTVANPHPLFIHFVKAVVKMSQKLEKA